MKLKMKTVLLQDMVSKAIKGASNNKMLPITSLMAIQCEKEVLKLTTTDGINTLQVCHEGVESDDFYACITIDTFSKLVAKTTSEFISLQLEENSLKVTGNGDYSIELPLDEEGKMIKFPTYIVPEGVPADIIPSTVFKGILTTNRPALAQTMEMPCLTGYYCAEDRVVTTDSYKVCNNEIKSRLDNVLVTPEMMELLALLEQETVTVQKWDDKLLFTTKDIIIYGTVLEGIEDYPMEAIDNYLQTEFTSKCVLSKQVVMNILDRLSLFISDYDKNGVYLTFTEKNVIFSSKKSNGTETVEYMNQENAQVFTCCADIELLMSQLTAQKSDTFALWYGQETAIKMVAGNVTQIVALLEDDRSEA